MKGRSIWLHREAVKQHQKSGEISIILLNFGIRRDILRDPSRTMLLIKVFEDLVLF